MSRRSGPVARVRSWALGLAIGGGLAIAACLPAAVDRAVAAEPVDVILDTDIGGDVDDVLALGLLHALADRGECRILAITLTKDHPLAAPFTDAVNTFYGRGDIPLGAVRDGKERQLGKYLSLAEARDGERLRYPRDVEPGTAPEAVGLLRRTLAGRPDGSVVIVQVGFSTNLARLLDSPPDEASPLSGRDLVKAKVRLLSVMAGACAPVEGQPNGDYREYNVVHDIPAARHLAADWPTPVIWSGFEIGIAMPYPAASIEQDYGYVAHHPLAEAYRLYEPPPHCRPTWDLTSVLQAVRPDRGYFGLSAPGRMIIKDDGRSRFVPAADGPHRHLVADRDQALRVVEAFVALCSQPPARQAPASDR
jgi:purine nucleosidase